MFELFIHCCFNLPSDVGQESDADLNDIMAIIMAALTFLQYQKASQKIFLLFLIYFYFLTGEKLTINEGKWKSKISQRVTDIFVNSSGQKPEIYLSSTASYICL